MSLRWFQADRRAAERFAMDDAVLSRVRRRVERVRDETVSRKVPGSKRTRLAGYVVLELSCGHEARILPRLWRKWPDRDRFPCVACPPTPRR